MADAVQPGGEATETPDSGQGAPAESPGLYKEVLDGVPEEFHPQLVEKLKGMDAKATQKFQSHSERVKPYEEAGVFDADPEQLTGWLNLSQALEAAANGDEQAQKQVHEWWDGLGDQLGFYEEEKGSPEDGPTDILDLDPKSLEDMVAKQTAEAVNPILERLEAQEQQQALAEAQEELQNDIRKLREEEPNLTDEDMDDILGLAYQHGQDSDNPLQVGLEKFKKIVARGESDLFASKVNQPGPAEAGGMPNTAAPVPTSENAKELALERLKQMSTVQ